MHRKMSTSYEVMSVGHIPGKLDISIHGQKLCQTAKFKYLGSILTEDGKMNKEIETNVQKARVVD